MLMGISLYLIISNGLKKKETRQSLAIFGVQLALNTLWSIVFFGLKSKFYGFVNILALWASILFMILSFYRISKKAALLLVPYIVWVTIATLLNYYVWILNP
jgi:tryptophan-rich sensory protein